MQTRPDHLLTLARERFAMQDYRGAIHHLLEVVESGRSFADVHHLLGVCWSMVGQPDRALESFDRALELNPRYIEAHIHRGLVLNEMGRVVEAEAAFTRAAAGGREGAGGLPAAVAGELANQHASLGEVYAELGALEEAIGQFRRAVELGPTFADLRHRLARLLLDAGRALEAREELERVLVDHPHQHDVQASLGLAHYLGGDPAGARAVWDACLANRPEDVRVVAYLAMLRRGVR
ncbi:MAG: tetratricopeptide repeat protein [Gemmatimonadota bacterium]|nr:tetratricopeptide repeat protein [Gemmatimonadota bacterium]